MEKKEVTAIDPVTLDGTTIVTVSKVIISGGHSKRGIAFSGSKQPDSVIIATPTTRIAFRITGEEINLDRLAQEIPEISRALL